MKLCLKYSVYVNNTKYIAMYYTCGNLRDVNFTDFTMGLPSVKFLSSKFSFIRILSIGRIQVNLKNTLAKILSKLLSMHYKILKN